MNSSVNNSWEYLQKEAEYLRSTYAELRKETRSLETYSLIAVGAIWSWCATNSNSSQVGFLIWLPMFIVVLFGIRAFGVYTQMLTIRKYLLELELKFSELLDNLGWEQFLNRHRLRAIWPITAFAFWITLNILTIVVPFLFK